MKAISLIPGTQNVSIIDVEEPLLKTDTQVKIKVLEVGICGTDREEAAGGRADAPKGKNNLILGHEMFGRVVETGSKVSKVKSGDYALFTVRRGCGACTPCKQLRSDMCMTGNYKERGIKGLDGFQSEFVVDEEAYVIRVPEDIVNYGVLTEPVSVVVKAIDESIEIQKKRLNGFLENPEWIKGKKVLVTGLGPIGLLACFVLKLRGADVVGMDVVDENTTRPQILKKIGGTYLDGRIIPATDLDDKIGQIDMIFEGTGVAQLQFELIDALGINGIYVLSGIPSEAHHICLSAGSLLSQMVLKNQIMMGCVNAGIKHYEMAVADICEIQKRWPGILDCVITERLHYTDFNKVLHNHSHDEIKMVLTWDK